jgi:hypothetical protein
LGAATALDHWIAVDVLGMTEETWTKLLNGELETDQEEAHGTVQVGNRARARDIVTTRGYLFPETILASMEEEEEEEGAVERELTREEEETNRSIDALLASLGGLDSQKDVSGNSSSIIDETSKDELLVLLVDQLQEWRLKNLETPYREWDADTRKNFNVGIFAVFVGILVSDLS